MARWLPIALLLAGGLAAAAALVAWSTCDCGKLSPEAELARVTVGLAFVIAGAAAMTQPGNHRVGTLMAAVGLFWFADDLGWIYHPVPYSLSRLTAGFFQPVLAHLAIAFPSGRLRTRTDRAIVLAAYVLWLVATVVTLVFWDPADAGCPQCPTNLFMVRRDPAAHDMAELVSTWLLLGMTAVVSVQVVRHWYAASQAGRRAYTPVLLASAPLAAGVALYSFDGRSEMPPLAPLAFTALPIAFLIGLLRIRLDRAEVGKLVVELGGAPAPSRLRDALARTLHDPSLQVVFWSREARAFVDAVGQQVALPAQSPRRVVTLLERGGEPIAALLHDPALQDDPELIEAAAAAARLVIENERLQAEIRAQLLEVRASRARIVEAADAERRRIERDLHDGSQQRLVTLSMALSLAQAHLDPDANADTVSLLREAADEVRTALAELRELARGIHPAILTEAGLGPAMESLANRSAVPVRIVDAPAERLPAVVEGAAYFVVAECLANAAKHASAREVTVGARHADGMLVVEVCDDGVGGADFASGSGLQGLADRIGALDGTLVVESPAGLGTRVVASIPCQ